MSRLEKAAREHGFLNMGLQVLESDIVVLQPGGEGSSLVMASFYALRDVVVQRAHLSARIGDRDNFKKQLNNLWGGTPELDKEFHPSAFESRARKLHPEGRPPRAR